MLWLVAVVMQSYFTLEHFADVRKFGSRVVNETRAYGQFHDGTGGCQMEGSGDQRIRIWRHTLGKIAVSRNHRCNCFSLTSQFA